MKLPKYKYRITLHLDIESAIPVPRHALAALGERLHTCLHEDAKALKEVAPYFMNSRFVMKAVEFFGTDTTHEPG